MARFLVADDEEFIVQVVEQLLATSGHTVVKASNGADALALLRSDPVDIAILDVMMPKMTGLEVCSRMRQSPELKNIPVLFLTGREELSDKVQGFEVGADDYVTKPFNLRELDARVKALLRFVRPVSDPNVLSVGTLEMNRGSNLVYVNGESVKLTPSEFDVLFFLASHAGEIISSRDLLKELWGSAAATGSTSLVRMHVLNIRRKIEQDPDNPRYILTIPRHGYVFKVE